MSVACSLPLPVGGRAIILGDKHGSREEPCIPRAAKVADTSGIDNSTVDPLDGGEVTIETLNMQNQNLRKWCTESGQRVKALEIMLLVAEHERQQADQKAKREHNQRNMDLKAHERDIQRINKENNQLLHEIKAACCQQSSVEQSIHSCELISCSGDTGSSSNTNSRSRFKEVIELGAFPEDPQNQPLTKSNSQNKLFNALLWSSSQVVHDSQTEDPLFEDAAQDADTLTVLARNIFEQHVSSSLVQQSGSNASWDEVAVLSSDGDAEDGCLSVVSFNLSISSGRASRSSSKSSGRGSRCGRSSRSASSDGEGCTSRSSSASSTSSNNSTVSTTSSSHNGDCGAKLKGNMAKTPKPPACQASADMCPKSLRRTRFRPRSRPVVRPASAASSARRLQTLRRPVLVPPLICPTRVPSPPESAPRPQWPKVLFPGPGSLLSLMDGRPRSRSSNCCQRPDAVLTHSKPRSASCFPPRLPM